MLTAVAAPVRISVAGCTPEGPGAWRFRWHVSSSSREPLRVEEAWLPHGRFRGEGHVPTDLSLEPNGGLPAVLELRVSCSEAPGTVVANAFLILRVRSATAAWRVFARMRVEFDASSVRPVVEVVTAQAL
jgi:hypothetical protein